MELNEAKVTCAGSLYRRVILDAKSRTRGTILDLEATETALGVIMGSLEKRSEEWTDVQEISEYLKNIRTLVSVLYTSIGEERGGKPDGGTAGVDKGR